MTDYTINALFLGGYDDLDPVEGPGNLTIENLADLIGETIGNADHPVTQQVSTVTLHDDDDDGLILEDDNGQVAEDITFEGVRAALDSSAEVAVRITYADGSVADATLVVAQDSLGRIFLMPRSEGSGFNSPFLDVNIESIEIIDTFRDGLRALTAQLEPDAFVCFVEGTYIRTPNGDRRIEDLSRGDLVNTLDSGPQRIVWIGNQTVAVTEKTAPVRITADALGPQCPSEDLYVSQQHRMLLSSYRIGKIVGVSVAFSAAKHLRSFDGVETAKDDRYITYYHLLLETHEILISNNAYTESVYLGPEARKLLTRRHLAELERLSIMANGVPVVSPMLARPTLRRRDVELLFADQPNAPLSRLMRSRTPRYRANALRRQLYSRTISLKEHEAGGSDAWRL
jgi:hypothetical protein